MREFADASLFLAIISSQRLETRFSALPRPASSLPSRRRLTATERPAPLHRLRPAEATGPGRAARLLRLLQEP